MSKAEKNNCDMNKPQKNNWDMSKPERKIFFEDLESVKKSNELSKLANDASTSTWNQHESTSHKDKSSNYKTQKLSK